jgi:hypothetical protein
MPDPVPSRDVVARPSEATTGERAQAALGALRKILVAAVVMAALAAAYVGAWFFLALQFRDGITDWVAARRAEGMTARYGTITLGGFPFRLSATVTQPALAARAPMAWSWQGEVAVVEARPWQLDRLKLHAPGTHAITFEVAPGRSETYRGLARALTADMVFVRGRPTRADVMIAGLVMRGGTPARPLSVAEARIKIERPPAVDPDYRVSTLEADIEAQNLRLPADSEPPLGRDLARLRLVGSVMGLIPDGPLAPAFERWRDAGGTIRVTRLETRYGPLSFAGDGTLALDGAMQPIGAFTARIEGFLETIDALRDRGLVRGRDAVTAKVVLGALARRSESGAPSLTIAVTVQDGKLYVGPVALLAVPRIPW